MLVKMSSQVKQKFNTHSRKKNTMNCERTTQECSANADWYPSKETKLNYYTITKIAMKQNENKT